MKPTIPFLIATLVAAAAAFAADGHDHDKVLAGPKGGRVLEVGSNHAEFFVQPDKKAAVYFYDGDLKPISPGAQEIVLTVEAPGGKSKIEFEKTPDGFLSKSAIPAGDPYRVVLQVRETAEAKPQNFRIDYNASTCGGCQKAEYACICGH